MKPVSHQPALARTEQPSAHNAVGSTNVVVGTPPWQSATSVWEGSGRAAPDGPPGSGGQLQASAVGSVGTSVCTVPAVVFHAAGYVPSATEAFNASSMNWQNAVSPLAMPMP